MRPLCMPFGEDLLFSTGLLHTSTDDSNRLPNDVQDSCYLPLGNSLSQGHLP